MKRLIKTVELEFFNDSANGEWGLTHKDTQDDRYGSSFNAFWSGMGIFHDIFEHSHEHQNKYFRGEYAMNIGGEIAAMGAMWYYIDQLGMYNRLNNRSIHAPSDIMRMSTEDMIHEAIEYGGAQYGSTLESNVPKQRPTDNGELESQILTYWQNVKKMNPEKNHDSEKEYGYQYKNSVTFRKIADLTRYGYRMAEKMVPDNWDNRTTLCDFFSVWDKFCQTHTAEEMKNMFSGITYKIYKENDRITWKAILHTADRFYIANDVTLTAENIGHFSPEDHYYMEHEEN
jgi:hypothetical protein